MFSELRSFLRERLPEYMVPSAFVLFVSPAAEPNGINRRASQHLMQHSKAANNQAPRSAGRAAQEFGKRF